MLGGQATALPKSSTVEMIRHLKVARDTAVKGRTQAMLTVKAMVVTAPAGLREQLDGITGKMTLIRRLAALRPGSSPRRRRQRKPVYGLSPGAGSH